jgi:hypothetical protein
VLQVAVEGQIELTERISLHFHVQVGLFMFFLL